MYYTIDYDKRLPEACHKDQKVLQKFIDSNDLSMALALVGSTEDVQEQLSTEEMIALIDNLTLEEPKAGLSETDLAELAWEALEFTKVLEFTPARGKKLAASGAKPAAEPQGAAQGKKPAKTSSKPASKGYKVKDLMGMSFTHGANTPRQGTSFEIFKSHLDENMDEATFDELVDAFKAAYVPKNPNKPVDDALGRAYVRDAFNGGYIEEAL